MNTGTAPFPLPLEKGSAKRKREGNFVTGFLLERETVATGTSSALAVASLRLSLLRVGIS